MGVKGRGDFAGAFKSVRSPWGKAGRTRGWVFAKAGWVWLVFYLRAVSSPVPAFPVAPSSSLHGWTSGSSPADGPPPCSREGWLPSSPKGCPGAGGPARTGSEMCGPLWPRGRACGTTSKDAGKAIQAGPQFPLSPTVSCAGEGRLTGGPRSWPSGRAPSQA